MTNTAKLKAKIAELGLLQEAVAMQLGMTSATFNYKLNNKTEFKASEIKKLADQYKIEPEKIKNEYMDEERIKEFKKDIAIQKAITLVTESAKEA